MSQRVKEMEGSTRAIVEDLCLAAKKASRKLALLDNETRSAALRAGAACLRDQVDLIGEENLRDIDAAEAIGLTAALIDRLRLTPERIDAMAAGMEQVAALPDPLAEEIRAWTTPSGLHIRQVRIPIGLIGVIYESRPNVTADVAALCLKSGNAVILKGGKEAIHSNTVIADLLGEEFSAAGIPDCSMELIRSTEREATHALLTQTGVVDMVIPRGGLTLQRAVAENAKVPVINHFEGVCHVYVDKDADLEMAEEITFTAKVGRPGVCNAVEKVVVHSDVAMPFLRSIGPRLTAAGVELRADKNAIRYLPDATPATDDDMRTEFLDLVLAVKVVDSIDDAINFINTVGSGHSDSIITKNRETADKFLAEVDSAVVYENASTRFTDGFQFGFGAEVGISTNRVHARGPMGLRELTTYKYIVQGDGQYI